MKLKMTKHAMTRWCQESELDQFKAAGWQPADQPKEAGEEVIRLRPPVKSRATEKKALEEANQSKGDE